MKQLKSATLISILSLSLFSCASKPLNIEEANIVIDNIQNKLNDSTFKFPTKITINKLAKKGEQYIDRNIIRFSLDDLYLYYSSGFEESSLNEHWAYVNKDEGKIYHLTSITKDNKSDKFYEVKDFSKENNFYYATYTVIKALLKSECVNFKDTLKDYEELNLSENQSSSLKISSSNEKNIELDISLKINDGKVAAIQSFENYLPKISKVYKVSDNKEEKNFETSYYYHGVNITRPNIHKFTLKK